eukprot:gene8133-12593_t
MLRKVLLCVILIAIITHVSSYVTCETDKILEYKFSSDVGAFGQGANSSLTLEGFVAVECAGKIQGKYTYVVSIPSAKLLSHSGGKKFQHNFKDNGDYSVFAQLESGKVVEFVNKPMDSKDKIPMMFYNLRKTVATFYQGKFDKISGSRSEKSPEGIVDAHYTFKEVAHDGTKGLNVIRKVTSKDIKKPIKGQRRRDTTFESTTSSIVSGGRIMRVNQRTETIFGTNEKGNEEYEEEKHYKGANKPDAKDDKRAKTMQNAEAASRFEFTKVLPNKKKSEAAVTLSMHKTVQSYAETQKMNIESIQMSPVTQEFARHLEVEKLERNTNFPALLRQLQQKTEDVSVFSKALRYAQTLKEKASGALVTEYKKLDLNKDLAFAKVLHVLLAATQTKEAQALLSKQMLHPNTMQSAMLSTSALEHPTDEVVHTLAAISSEKKLGVLSHTGHLLFAHTASKTQNKLLGQQVLGKISLDMSKAKTADEFSYHVKALANAGQIVPLGVLSKFIESEHLPLNARVDATHALQHRVSEDDVETTEYIHNLLDSDVHEEIKTAAVHAQTEREKVLQTGDSVLEFHRHFEALETPHSVLGALRLYYQENASATSLEILEANNLGTKTLFFRRAWRSVKRVARKIKRGVRKVGGHIKRVARKVKKHVKKVGRRIKKGVRKIGSRIKKVARKVKHGVTKIAKKVVKIAKKAAKATWKGIKYVAKKVAESFTYLLRKAKEILKKLKEKFLAKAQLSDTKKICIQDTQGKQLCAHNSAMMQWVRSVDRQFGLATYHSSSALVHEKVFGIRLAYFYAGIMIYTASTQPSKCTSTNLKFLGFQRMDIQLGLFGKRVPLISTDAYLGIDMSNIYSKSAVKDKFRLTLVGKLHLWELSLVPKPMKSFLSCDKMYLYMMEENQNFAQWEIQMMVGPVPIVIKMGVYGSFKLIYQYALCSKHQIYDLEVEPEYTVGPLISGGIGIPLFSGGLEGMITMGYSFPLTMGKTKCNRCSVLLSRFKPLDFRFSAYLEFLGQRLTRDLYTWSLPYHDKTIGFSCEDESAKKDFDVTTGTKPLNIRIEKAALGNNLLFNLAFAYVRQKAWLSLVKAYLNKRVSEHFGSQYREWTKRYNADNGLTNDEFDNPPTSDSDKTTNVVKKVSKRSKKSTRKSTRNLKRRTKTNRRRSNKRKQKVVSKLSNKCLPGFVKKGTKCFKQTAKQIAAKKQAKRVRKRKQKSKKFGRRKASRKVSKSAKQFLKKLHLPKCGLNVFEVKNISGNKKPDSFDKKNIIN